MRECETKHERLSELLLQTGHGDGQAFRQLYLSTSNQLLHHAARIVRSREVGEEVLQESFIAIWRQAASFDRSRSAPLTWMMAIVRNKSVDYLRANYARNFFTVGGWEAENAEEPADPQLDPCVSVEREQRRLQVTHGLTSLNILHRKAIELCFYKELSHAEVASEMTLPLGTVKTWIRRGCQQIRQHLEHQAA